MEDQTTPIAASSEQSAAPAATSSEQGQVQAESTTPATTAAPEPKEEPKQKEDPDTILRQVREQTRRELESEYGKKQSAAIREANERAVAEREALLTHLGQFAPDDEVAKARQTIQERGLRDQLAYYQQQDQQRAAMQQLGSVAQRNWELVKEAGLEGPADNPWKYVKDITGETPQDAFTFPERFARLAAKRLLEANKDADKREKKAREEAERETEMRLGVPRLSGTTPTGSGHTGLRALSDELASAAARGDKARVSELRDAIYKEAGLGR